LIENVVPHVVDRLASGRWRVYRGGFRIHQTWRAHGRSEERSSSGWYVERRTTTMVKRLACDEWKVCDEVYRLPPL